jgi:hypothetical protein
MVPSTVAKTSPWMSLREAGWLAAPDWPWARQEVDGIKRFNLGYPSRVRLTKAARNELFEAVRKGGLDPAGCTLRGYGVYRQVAQNDIKDSWDESLKRFFAAFGETTLTTGSDPLSEAPQENSRFTDDEREQITAELYAIRTELRNQGNLTAEQLAIMNAKLDEADQASKRLSRKDWVTYFLGLMTTVVVAGTVPPESANHVMVAVLHGLADMFFNPPMPHC